MTPGERDTKIVEEFNRRRKRQLILAVVVVAGVIWFSWTMERSARGSQTARGFVMFAAVLGAVAYSFKNWRCPACNKYLGKTLFMAFCPMCGAALK